MAPDPLQQLRDIHMPDPPGWWPPAPGWWIVAALLLTGIIWLLWRGWRARQRRRPIRQARQLYAQIHQRYLHGELTPRAYLDQSNEILKRVLIHGLGEHQARRASGQDWLELLDRHLDEPAFTQGPGRLLGNARFRPGLEIEATAVHPLVERLLQRLSPQKPAGVS